MADTTLTLDTQGPRHAAAALRDRGFYPGRELRARGYRDAQATLRGRALWCSPGSFPCAPTFAAIRRDGSFAWVHEAGDVDALRADLAAHDALDARLALAGDPLR